MPDRSRGVRDNNTLRRSDVARQLHTVAPIEFRIDAIDTYSIYAQLRIIPFARSTAASPFHFSDFFLCAAAGANRFPECPSRVFAAFSAAFPTTHAHTRTVGNTRRHIRETCAGRCGDNGKSASAAALNEWWIAVCALQRRLRVSCAIARTRARFHTCSTLSVKRSLTLCSA